MSDSEHKSFLFTVPGILTGLAALVTAIGGLVGILLTAGVFERAGATVSPVSTSPMPTPTQLLVPTPTAARPTAAAAATATAVRTATAVPTATLRTIVLSTQGPLPAPFPGPANSIAVTFVNGESPRTSLQRGYTGYEVEVNYSYNGDHGKTDVYIVGYPVRKDGTRVPGVEDQRTMNVGAFTTSLVFMTEKVLESSGVEVCMRSGGAAAPPFYCQRFSYPFG